MNKKRAIIIFSIIFSAGIFVAYKNVPSFSGLFKARQDADDKKSEKSANAEDVEVSRPVAVEPVVERDIENLFTTQANLQPIKEAILRPPSGVNVQKVFVKWGEKVKRGQILVNFESETQKLKNELDRLDLQSREKEFNLNKKLAERNFISGSEFEQKEAEFKSATLRQKMSDLESARIMRSPVDGIVSEVSMRTGDYVDGNSSNSIKIIDNSSFKIMLFVPQSVATKISTGQKVNFKHVAEGGEGIISAISPSVDPKTGSVLVEIITKKIPKRWISGMYVEVKVPIESVSSVVAIPTNSILYEDSKPFVFKLETDDKREPSSNKSDGTDTSERAKKVWIKTSVTDGQFVQVTEGLEAADLIVIRGQSLLKDGSKVEIQE